MRRGCEGEAIERMSFMADEVQAVEMGKGFGHLCVEVVAGQSAATSVCASSPLKILVPRSRGRSVWAYLSSFGGGMVAGDETNLSVEVGAGATCFLSTQASTKIYRNPRQRPCGHKLSAELGEGAILALAPDPVQAFAGSAYVQRQEFRLKETSGLVLVDWISAGRAARGERWAFDQYQSRNEIFVAGKRVLLDTLFLDTSDGALGGNHRMGRVNCLATVILIGEPFREAGSFLLKEIAARPVMQLTSLLCSASALRDGVILRLAGESVEAVGQEIHRQLAFLGGVLHDDPWARKW